MHRKRKRSPEEKLADLKSRGRSENQIRAVAIAREDMELLALLRSRKAEALALEGMLL